MSHNKQISNYFFLSNLVLIFAADISYLPHKLSTESSTVSGCSNIRESFSLLRNHPAVHLHNENLFFDWEAQNGLSTSYAKQIKP